MRKLNAIDWITLILVIVGAVNWGLIGLFDIDLVATLFGQMTFMSRLVYAIVGIAGVYLAFDTMQLAKKEPSTSQRHAHQPM